MADSVIADGTGRRVRAVLDVDAAAGLLEAEQPLDILRWASEGTDARVTFATGFGPEGCVIIDLIGRHQLPIDVFTLDTGLLFPETYALWHELELRYGVTIRAVRPKRTVAEQAASLGDSLWEREPNRCCELRKVEPLASAIAEAKFTAWITAIRREQTPERANAKVVERDRRFGIIKVNPLVRWTRADLWRHVLDHQIPYNPLHDQGYPSIGCAPCTSKVAPGEDPRSGRWRGQGKNECGLHLPVVSS